MLYYTQDGAGKDLVLLAGLAGSTRYYDEMLDELVSAGFKVTRIDMLGFGKSRNLPAEDYSLQSHTKALSEVFEEENITNAKVVGFSASCSLALHFASHYPERVQSLTLFSPALYSSYEEGNKLAYKAVSLPKWFLSGSFSKLLCKTMCSVPFIAVPLYTLLGSNVPAKVKRDSRLHTWESYSQTVQMVLQYRIEDDIQALKAAVEIYYGDEDTSIEVRFIEGLKNDQIQPYEVHGAGHQIPYLRKELWLKAVKG